MGISSVIGPIPYVSIYLYPYEIWALKPPLQLTTQVINIYADQRIVSESIITVFVIFAVSLLIFQNIFSAFIAL